MEKRNTETRSETDFRGCLFHQSFRRSIERNTETPETHTYRCVSVFRFRSDPIWGEGGEERMRVKMASERDGEE